MAETYDHIGPYEIRGELGHGAMARVWRGWDPNLEREVAIKEPIFDPSLSSNILEELAERFVAEGRAVARLSHPGIVTVFAADVWDGHPAIVMELVEGTTLATLLTAGPLSTKEALSIADQLLDAVGYAHKRGVIHRDIKPENIFITLEGRAKLADFGIAHVEDSSISHATVVGAVLGTPGYMSPEQARGLEIDARSDLFSIAVILNEMLTGKNPFGVGDADGATLLYRIVNEPVAELPDDVTAGLSVDIRPVIYAALAKNPDDRPATAEKFKEMLHGMRAVNDGQTSHQDAIGMLPLTGATSASGADSPGGVTMLSDRYLTMSEAQREVTSVKKTPSWFPYAVVGVLGALALLFAFISASSNSSGGSTGVFLPTAGEGTSVVATNPGSISVSYRTGYGNNDVISEASYIADSQYILEPCRVDRSGYEFVGWKDSLTGEEYLANTPVASAVDTTYVAMWEKDDATSQNSATSVIGTNSGVNATSANATSFPRQWYGWYEGQATDQNTGAVNTVRTSVDLLFDSVKDSGELEGTCAISAASNDGGRSGSFKVRGSIDWNTGRITLLWAGWINEGNISTRRNFEGVYDSATNSISGTCSVQGDTSNSGVWRMSA